MMDFSFFSKLDALHQRLLESSALTLNAQRMIGPKRRERMLNSIFAEVRVQKRQFKKDCRKYTRFIKKVDKGNNRVQKLLLKTERKKEKKCKGSRKI